MNDPYINNRDNARKKAGIGKIMSLLRFEERKSSALSQQAERIIVRSALFNRKA
jgi:hypothetical protein